MSQNRVSPASSPMRRPSGSGSVGVGSPLPDRPQSVENPLTPRSTGSGPHTPSSMSSANVNCGTGMENLGSQHSGADHFMTENMQTQDMNPGGSHVMQNYGMYSAPSTPAPHQQTDYGGGGGGANSQVIPFPKFSWFDGPVKLGLKGGSPFSVVNGSPSGHSTNIMPEQGQVSLENNLNESITSVNHTNSTTGNELVNNSSAVAPPTSESTAVLSPPTDAEGSQTVQDTSASVVTDGIKVEPSVKSVPVSQSEATVVPPVAQVSKPAEAVVKVEAAAVLPFECSNDVPPVRSVQPESVKLEPQPEGMASFSCVVG